MRKDIILKLAEYGELNQSKLMAYCGLNNSKHRGILDELVEKDFIRRREEPWGAKKVILYRVSEKGEKLPGRFLSLTNPYSREMRRQNRDDKWKWSV